MSTPKELQEKIERHRQEIELVARVPTLAAAPTLLASQQSEMFVAASRLAEISTRRIVRLTWGLIWLTAGLLLVSIVTLVTLFVEYGSKTP